MTPPVRHLSLAGAALFGAGALLALAIGVRAVRTAADGEPPGSGPAAPSAAAPARAAVPAAPADASPLAGVSAILAPRAAAPAGELARRYRLAGTVLGGHAGGAAEPMAILDVRDEGAPLARQIVAVPSVEVAPGVRLVSVSSDSVVLSGPGGEETLRLERAAPFRPAAVRAAGGDAAETSGDGGDDDPRERAVALFGGRQVADGRWEFPRERALAFYDELRAEPERMLRVFDAMDPVWVADADGERRIEGYRYRAELGAEPDFFAAVGLQDGDVVLRVNSLLMTRREQGEAMISSFIRGDGSMYVVEVERDGRIFKQVFDFE